MTNPLTQLWNKVGNVFANKQTKVATESRRGFLTAASAGGAAALAGATIAAPIAKAQSSNPVFSADAIGAGNYVVTVRYNTGAENAEDVTTPGANDSAGYNSFSVCFSSLDGALGFVDSAPRRFFGLSEDPKTWVSIASKDGSNFIQSNGMYTNFAVFNFVSNPAYTQGSTTEPKLITSPAVPVYNQPPANPSDPCVLLTWENMGIYSGLVVGVMYGFQNQGIANLASQLNSNSITNDQKPFWAKVGVNMLTNVWNDFVNGPQNGETPQKPGCCPTPAPQSAAKL